MTARLRKALRADTRAGALSTAASVALAALLASPEQMAVVLPPDCSPALELTARLCAAILAAALYLHTGVRRP